LDVPDHLLGVLVGRSQDVDLRRTAVAVHDDPCRRDLGDSAELPLDLGVIQVHDPDLTGARDRAAPRRSDEKHRPGRQPFFRNRSVPLKDASGLPIETP